jgi:predicted dehydrogenase
LRKSGRERLRPKANKQLQEYNPVPRPIAEGRPIRWGILGAGAIADTFSSDVSLTDGNVVTAVAARDADRAARFAARHGAARSYGDYAALVNDDDIDVVYIATTHPYHRAHALLAIEAGKSVLIEKPVCLNAADAREVFAAATRSDVFAMEAMWTRTNPLIRTAQQLIADGAIGEVRGARSEFGLGIAFDPAHRLYDLDNGGGALLDLGIYPATFAYLFLGRPDEIRTVGTLSPAGADDTVAMQWLYDGRPGAQLWASVPIAAPNEAAVLGTKGWIAFLPEAHRPSGLIVHNESGEYRVDDPLAGRGHGYGPEIDEVGRCLRAGLLQSPLIPHADTIAILEILDGARAELGVIYPSER